MDGVDVIIAAAAAALLLPVAHRFRALATRALILAARWAACWVLTAAVAAALRDTRAYGALRARVAAALA